MRAWWIVVGLAGCYDTNAGVICGDLRCPTARVCSPAGDACVTQLQIDACAGRNDGEGCSVPGMEIGVCASSVCVTAGCGNALVEPGEACDDGNRVSLDGCNSSCTSREMCGDGTTDFAFGEDCDNGSANSDEPGAECRTNCRLARCGDGIVDPQETCDDGNTLSFDGCRGDCQGRFAKMATPTVQALYGAYTNGTEAWAGGEGRTLLYFDGTTWVRENLPAGFETIGHVWAASRNDVFLGMGDAVYRWTGTLSSPQPLTEVVSAIWGAASDDVYVTTYSGTLWHYNGTWSVVSAAINVCGGARSVWGRSATDVYVVGNEGLCRFDGNQWSVVTGPAADSGLQLTISGNRFYTFAGPTPECAVFDHATDPATKIVIPGCVLAIGFAGDELLGVGNSGAIVSYDGTWRGLISPTELSLQDVVATSPQNVFVVGLSGTILH